VPSLRGCHASCPRHAHVVPLPRARRVRAIKASAHSAAVQTPPLAPASPHAPLTAVVQSRAPLSAPDRTCLTVPCHRRWQATPTASALVRPPCHRVFTLNRPRSPLSAAIALPSHLSTIVPHRSPPSHACPSAVHASPSTSSMPPSTPSDANGNCRVAASLPLSARSRRR
jgi:hypothetical protein